jgi:hypothetical protein
MTETDLTLHDAIQVIVGTQLSSLTFVMDYWQLAFDGHVFSIMTWLAVDADDRTTRSGRTGSGIGCAHKLPKLSAQPILRTRCSRSPFEDDSTIQAFARDEDYRQPCPEALLFQSYEFKTLYVV